MIILLTLPEACNHERVKQRHDGDEILTKEINDWGEKSFVPFHEEEELVYTVEIEEQMTREDVVNQILKVIEKK